MLLETLPKADEVINVTLSSARRSFHYTSLVRFCFCANSCYKHPMMHQGFISVCFVAIVGRIMNHLNISFK